MKFGNRIVWGQEQFWCHCFLHPGSESKVPWGTHLIESVGGKPRLWEYFPDYVPDSPSDRPRTKLPSGNGFVSASIKEITSMTGGDRLDIRVAMNIRIDKL